MNKTNATPLPDDIDTVEIIKELYKVYDGLNQFYFNNELPKVFIVVTQGKAKKKSYYGKFCKEAWSKVNKKNKDENEEVTEITKPNPGPEHYHEIQISSDYFYRGSGYWAATMCHEMVHLYCAINNIKETSNNGVYHNKKFKQIAEEKGLNIEEAKTIGWSVTYPTYEFLKFVSSLDINKEPFRYYRDTRLTPSKKAPKKRFVCPKCAIDAQAKKKAKLVCGNCNMPMDYWDLTDPTDYIILQDNNEGYAKTNGWYAILEEQRRIKEEEGEGEDY